MAAAEPAALQALGDWERFDLIPNRRTADLIFLLSANPYLGDQVTRDEPDTRPVHAAMATGELPAFHPALGDLTPALRSGHLVQLHV